MSWVKDKFFGGAEKTAGRMQVKNLKEAQNIVTEQAGIARDDVNRLFGQQEQNSRAGLQAGLDLYGKTIPAQFEQAQAGNMNAQNMLSGALPQMNNAILGNAIDYSQFQPQSTPEVDMNMFNVDMPNYTNIDGTDNFTPEPIQEPVMQEPVMDFQPQNFLGGSNAFNGRNFNWNKWGNKFNQFDKRQMQ